MASVPVYRANSASSASVNAISITTTIPAEVEAGDFMVLVVSYKRFVGSSTMTTPSGWTVLAGPQDGSTGNTMQGAVYGKVSDGSETSVEVVTTASQQINTAFAAYDLAGATARSVSWVTGGTTGVTTIPHPDPSPAAQSGDLIIVAGALRSATAGGQPTITGAGGVTIRAQSMNISGSAENMGAYVGDADDVSGTKNATAASATYLIAGQIVLQPGVVALDRATSESVTLSDTLGRALTRPRASAEALTLASAAAVGVARARGVAQSLTLSDASSRNTARVRALAEGLGLVDATGTIRARSRATAETVTLVDATGTTRARARSTSEAMTLSLALGYTQSRALSAAAAIALSDTAGRQVTGVRAQPETLTLTGAGAVAQQTSIGVAEAIALGHAFGRAVNRSRSSGEGLSFDSSSVAAGDIARYAGEAIALVDAAEVASIVLVTADVGLELGDAAGAVTAQGRVAGEAIALVDTFVRGVVRARSFGQTLAITDGWSTARFAMTGWAETLALDAAASRAATSTGRALPEAIALGHTFMRVVARARAFGESVAIVDGGWLAARSIIPTVTAEEISFSMQAAARSARSRGFGENVVLWDTTARQINRPRARAETITLGELFSVVRGRSVFVSQGLTLEDSVERSSGRSLDAGVAIAIVALFFVGDQAPGQIPIAYPHRIRMTSRPATVRDTTAGGGTVRRTV